MNTHDWLASYDIQEINAFDVLEVSFKNGARKDFFHTNASLQVYTGDSVLVEIAGGGGYDIGNVSLSGELVRMQIKKKGLRDDALFLNVIRKTNERDVERLNHYRSLEIDMLMHSRAISRSLGLDMKVGEVEMQGDGRKATFLYTADGRVDFRELIRAYNKEFKVKIEMRQIGARQEAARIGGVGSCGRELCCSTWLSDFKSISTAAARYQQLAINQVKLSGMCGRLKCCLNYELDAYLDALESFPPNPERIFTKFPGFLNNQIHGYQEVCRQTGYKPEVLVLGNTRITPANVQASSFQMGVELAKRPRSDRPDAVICHNDVIALSVYNGLLHGGLRAPDDIGLVGFDGIDAGKYIPNGPLTTVRMPVEGLARAALDILIKRIGGDVTTPSRQVLIPTELIVGGTT